MWASGIENYLFERGGSERRYTFRLREGIILIELLLHCHFFLWVLKNYLSERKDDISLMQGDSLGARLHNRSLDIFDCLLKKTEARLHVCQRENHTWYDVGSCRPLSTRPRWTVPRVSKMHGHVYACPHKIFQNLCEIFPFERGTCQTGPFSYFWHNMVEFFFFKSYMFFYSYF